MGAVRILTAVVAMTVGSCTPTPQGAPSASVDPAGEIAKLPAPLRERFDTPAGQREMRRALEDKAQLIAEARRRGFAETPSIKAEVQALEDRLAVQAMLKEERAAVVVTDEDRRAYYDAHRDAFQLPERRVVRRLLCAVRGDAGGAQKCAEQALERLRRRERSFIELAKDGDGAERIRDGLMTPRQRSDFDDATADVVFAAGKGDVVGPVTNRDGVQLLLVEEIIPPTTRPFEQVKPEIDHRLEPTLERRAFERLVGGLRATRDQAP